MSRTVSENPRFSDVDTQLPDDAVGQRVQYTARFLRTAGIPKTNEMWTWCGQVVALEGNAHVRVSWDHAPSPTWRVERANLRREVQEQP